MLKQDNYFEPLCWFDLAVSREDRGTVVNTEDMTAVLNSVCYSRLDVGNTLGLSHNQNECSRDRELLWIDHDASLYRTVFDSSSGDSGFCVKTGRTVFILV